MPATVHEAALESLVVQLARRLAAADDLLEQLMDWRLDTSRAAKSAGYDAREELGAIRGAAYAHLHSERRARLDREVSHVLARYRADTVER